MLIFTSLIYKKYKSHSKNKNKLKQEINTKHTKRWKGHTNTHTGHSLVLLYPFSYPWQLIPPPPLSGSVINKRVLY